MFKNGPGSDLSGNQVRDKLTDIALKVLEENNKLGSGPKSQAFGEFRSRLTPNANGNGGGEGFADFKHCSMFPFLSVTNPLGSSSSSFIFGGGNKLTSDYSQDRPTERYSCHCMSYLAYKLMLRAILMITQPTVLFDGLKEDVVSSSWGKDEWEKFLA